jgi:hypothetical protein
MTAFVNAKASKSKLIILNNWRLYYKVMLLSEICFASGKGIQPFYLEYDHSTLAKPSQSTLNWPIQGKPDRKSFIIWKRYLKQCFLNPENKQIPQLGAWDIQEIQQTSPRYGYYSKNKRQIFIPIPQHKFKCFKAYDIQRKSARYDPTMVVETTTLLPNDAVPVDPYKYPDSTFIKFKLAKERITQKVTDEDTLWRWEILRHLQILKIEPLIQDLDNKLIPINIVSDGGVH